ncbi:ribonuclease HII [Candidatus Bipolaricaulota bacterium]|nr:ribonuclease HII [Candidatus Bipolaricaulota bacterium]
MNCSSAGKSGIPSANIDRARRLLSFDRAFSSASQQDRFPDLVPDGQIPLSFADSEGSLPNHAPHLRLVGFDEAGRGALAGPVTVACVCFELSRLFLPTGDLRNSILETYADLNDSKRVTERVRERLYHRILEEAHWGIGHASAFEIDRLGIVQSCRIAALRSYRCLGNGPDHGIRADVGLFDRGLSLREGEEGESIPASIQCTRGDARSFHIAAASILAKVGRDAIMKELEKRASVYGFAGHKGYGTTAHRAAIGEHGPSRFHRRTFLSS